MKSFNDRGCRSKFKLHGSIQFSCRLALICRALVKTEAFLLLISSQERGKESEKSNEEGNVLRSGHLKIFWVLSHIPRASFPPGL